MWFAEVVSSLDGFADTTHSLVMGIGEDHDAAVVFSCLCFRCKWVCCMYLHTTVPCSRRVQMNGTNTETWSWKERKKMRVEEAYWRRKVQNVNKNVEAVPALFWLLFYLLALLVCSLMLRCCCKCAMPSYRARISRFRVACAWARHGTQCCGLSWYTLLHHYYIALFLVLLLFLLN